MQKFAGASPDRWCYVAPGDDVFVLVSHSHEQDQPLVDAEEEPAPQDPLTPPPLEQPPVVIGAEPVPESELPAPVLEHRSLSVLERCIALRIVHGRGYS